MKNTKKTAECQQTNQQKKQKGQITRHNHAFISIRNEEYIHADVNFSYQRAHELICSIKVLPLAAQRMLYRLLSKIIYNNNPIAIARNYYQVMLGYCSKTISTYIRAFEELDLIRVEQYFKKVCVFSIGPAAYNEIIRNKLVAYVPSLRLMVRLSFQLLMSSQVHASEFPLLFKKDINNPIAIAEKKIKYRNKGIEHVYEQVLANHMPMLRYISQQFPIQLIKKQLNKEQLVMIQSLELTEAGKINLTIFPQDAIAFADNKLIVALRKGATVANPFQFLCKVAHAWCKDRNINPDYRAMFNAFEQLGYDDSTKKFTRILIDRQSSAIEQPRYQAWDKKAHEQSLEVYNQEQLQWAHMDDNQRREYLRPMIYKMCERKCESWAQRYCPFKGAEQLIDELIAEFQTKAEAKADKVDSWNIKPIQEQQSIWAPLIPQLAILTPELRAHYLKKSGCDYAIDIVEQLVADYVKKETTHADGHISNQR